MAVAVSAGQGSLDAALLASAATGDAGAFDALIRSRLDRLYRMAYAITRDASDAQDAVQDACVSAWRELPRLRDHTRFDSWLNQILVNSCRAQLRRRRRVHVREVAPLDGGDDAAPSAGPGPAETMGEVEAIRRAFERLDAANRTLLVLHYVEERSVAEIAESLGSPVGTIKWRLSRARAALDRALEVEQR